MTPNINNILKVVQRFIAKQLKIYEKKIIYFVNEINLFPELSKKELAQKYYLYINFCK
ncbi:hypothetical protein pb186bvf_007943 [Paramecium bursaria]